jgi:hypothetical protein
MGRGLSHECNNDETLNKSSSSLKHNQSCNLAHGLGVFEKRAPKDFLSPFAGKRHLPIWQAPGQQQIVKTSLNGTPCRFIIYLTNPQKIRQSFMPEFKFSCPQCGQHIQCDTAYAGAQINCPGCQQSITVPQPPGVSAPPPLPPVAPSGARVGAAPIAGQRPSAPPPPAKSHTLRNVLVITACVVFVLFAGLVAFGWITYSKIKAKQLVLQKGNPAAIVPVVTAAQHQEALDLLSKMQNAYTNLNTLEASGTSVMALDMSQLTTGDLNPNAKKTAKTHRPANFPKSITTTMEISIKLERPNMYMVRENSHMKMMGMTMSNTMVTWSPGDTNYSFFLMNNGTFKRYTTSPDRDTALMAGGQPSLLAMGMMKLFFNNSENTPQLIQDLGQTEDDNVNGQDCYTLTAKIFGQKLKTWVSKKNYLILQSQLTLGAPVSDADMDAAFKSFNTSTNTSAAKLAQEKAQAKQQAAMMTKIRGTITDTSDNVQVNPALTPDDFHYQVPRGTKLVPGQN